MSNSGIKKIFLKEIEPSNGIVSVDPCLANFIQTQAPVINSNGTAAVFLAVWCDLKATTCDLNLDRSPIGAFIAIFLLKTVLLDVVLPI